MVGLIHGMVMRVICCQRVAPSNSADSYSALLIPTIDER